VVLGREEGSTQEAVHNLMQLKTKFIERELAGISRGV
jgi:hypothetical protein